MNLKEKILLFSATGFGSGYLPKIPGTWGTCVAVVIYIALFYIIKLSNVWLILLSILTSIYGIYAANYGEKYFKKLDPGQVVIDEIAGYFITMLFVPVNWINIILGFFIFRILDILKPPPAYKLQKLHGGLGIMIDDIIVGFYGMIILLLLNKIFPSFIIKINNIFVKILF